MLTMVKTTNICIILSFITCFKLGLLYAEDVYVSQDGQDGNPCSKTEPCKTLARAVSIAPDNSLIHVAGGKDMVYREDSPLNINKPLTIQQYGEYQPHIVQSTVNITSDHGHMFFKNITFEECIMTSYAPSVSFTDIMLHRTNLKVYALSKTKTNLERNDLNDSSLFIASNQGIQNVDIQISLDDIHCHGNISEIQIGKKSIFQTISIEMKKFSISGNKTKFKIENYKNLELTIDNMTVRNTKFQDHGIEIQVGKNSKANIDVRNSTFTSNILHLSGLIALFSQEGSDVRMTLENVMFNQNQAIRGGTAVMVDCISTCQLFVTNSSFKNNLNYESGAGLLLSGANVTIESSQFVGNKVKTERIMRSESTGSKGAGGALLVQESVNLSIAHCSFVNNSADWMGGSIASGGNVTLFNTTFENASNRTTSSLGDILYMSGKVQLGEIDFIIQYSHAHAPIIWYSSQRDGLVALGSGRISVQCPQGSQFVNQSLIDVDDQDLVFKTLFILCNPCPDDYYSLLQGYYEGSLALGDGNWSKSFECFPCPYGAVCQNGGIQAKHNFWGYPTGDPPQVRMKSCPDGYCCDDDVCPTYTTCEDYRTGTMCGECSEGLSELIHSTKCKENDECHDYWYFILTLLTSALSVLFFMYQVEVGFFIMRNIFAKKSTQGDNVTVIAYIKSIFYFYQTVNLLNITDNMAAAQIGLELQPVLSSLMSFKPLAIFYFVCPFPNINPVVKTFFEGIPTILMVVYIAIFYLCHKAYKTWQASQCQGNDVQINQIQEDVRHVESADESPPVPQNIRSVNFNARLACGFVTLFLLNYVNITNMTFKLLVCTPVDNVEVLYIDGNVECLTSWQIVLIFFTVIHVAPLFMAVIVSRILYSKDQISLPQFLISYILPLPMLLYWASLWAYKRIKSSSNLGVRTEDADEDILDVSGNGNQDSSSRQDKERGVIYEAIKRAILMIVERPYKKPDGQHSLLYWEGVLILRRLIIILIRTAVLEPVTMVTLQTTICLLFLIWHIKAFPFANNGANYLETVFLTIMTLIGMCHVVQGAFITSGLIPNGPTLEQILITDWIQFILVNLLPLLFVSLLLVAIIIGCSRRIVGKCIQQFQRRSS